jgi:AraC-like DNA-binding protein
MHHVTASPHMALDEKPLGVTAWHLGPILVASSDLGSLHLSRQREQIQRDRIDHIAVAAGRAGTWRGTAASSFTMAPGEMCVDDMGQKLQTELIHARALQAVFPRDVLRGVDAAAAHATILRTPTAGLFIEYLQALVQRLPLLDQRDVPRIGEITVDLFLAALNPDLANLERARSAISMTLLQRVRSQIDAQLHDPTLSPASIATALHISRARLYGLLEPHGGVARYLLVCRLNRAMGLLRERAAPRPIKEIAYQVGFVSEAHFSRAFRRHFGCTPSDARAGSLDRMPAPSDIWLDWLRDLG